MVSRVQARDDELRRHFDLQAGELFMDEFYCALHKKILLQGRMYVFENYVCFYSNLFGWVKKKVIPLVEVIEISKKRHYGFPNSIRIVWNSKKEFFTSFLSREDAYVLLINVWNQAQLAAQTPEPGENALKGEAPGCGRHCRKPLHVPVVHIFWERLKLPYPVPVVECLE